MPCSFPRLTLLLAAIALATSGLASTAARSQEDQALQSAERPDEAVTLSPLTVTARKREEDSKDVPFGLTAVDSLLLEDARIHGAQDLYRMVPNFGFTGFNSARFSYYSIRGVGPLTQPLSPDDTSVVTYVDGVPQPLFGADLSFLDIEQVEVLRGPQGTLFGRNTSAGAINITTRKPGDELELALKGEYGEQGWALGEASASGMLIEDRLGGRLAFRYQGADSFVSNIQGDDLGDYDSYALRGSLVLTPSERTSITLGGFGESLEQEPPVFILLQNDDYPQAASTESRADRQVGAGSLSIAHELDWATLHAITGVNRVENQINTDDSDGLIFGSLFGLPADVFAPETDFSNWDEEEVSVSQELRLNSPADSEIAWVGGLAYYYDNFDARYENQSAFFASTNGVRDIELATNSLSAFGEATVPLLDRLKGTAGLRYSYDWKDYDARFTGNGFPGTVASFEESGDLTYSYVTGRAALSYDATPDSTVYASLARGYKDGGFPRFPTDSATGQATEPYDSAKTWTYEAGSKNRLFGGRAQLDLAVFLNDVSDEQLYAFDAGSATFRPANVDVRSYGVELEGGVRLAPGLDLTAALGYTHATLRDVGADLSAVAGAEGDNKVPNVPDINAAVGLQYFGAPDWLALPEGLNLLARFDYQYQAGRYADVANELYLDAYHVINARLGVDLDYGSLYLFASNLLDEQYELNGNHYAVGVDAGVPARGRVLGVGATLRF